MGYIINRYNGTVLTTVEDGTVNLTTEVKFVGKNFAGYGETQNENFLHLMENFANPTPPGKPLSGMIWFDSTTNKIKFYDGVRWRTTGSAEVNTVQPIGNVEGDLWWNSATKQLYARSADGEWVLVGPQTTALGTTQFISRLINGFNELGTLSQYAIIEAVLSDGVNENTTLLISNDDFTIAPEDDIANFTNFVKKGITLADTDEEGISTETLFWGTASNALKLEGFSASDFINKLDLDFPDSVTIDNILFLGRESKAPGVTGGSNEIGVVQNTATSTISFIINNSVPVKVLNISPNGLTPAQNLTFNLGTSSLRWNEVHANLFKGIADNADALKVGTTYRVASDNVGTGTIVARTSSSVTIPGTGQVIPAGAIRSNFFVGTAVTAQYADLAEKYTTEQEWPVGTAMAVCSHGDHEACPASASSIAIGVISDAPAYLMNAESTGQAIGLKGRVPVRVKGAVKKGQAVYAWENGVCSTIATTALVGIALESNADEDEKLVECVLKV
jgi:hypothetical protein